MHTGISSPPKNRKVQVSASQIVLLQIQDENEGNVARKLISVVAKGEKQIPATKELCTHTHHPNILIFLLSIPRKRISI